TVKADGHGQISRGEWEAEVGDLKPRLRKPPDSPLRKLGARKLARRLRPVFKTQVQRTVIPLRAGRAEIELAIDRGKIASGRRQARLSEVELELKRGRPSELFRLARTIEHRAQAELYLPSKSDRGYDFTRGKEKPIHSATPIALMHGMAAIAAF